MLFIFSTTYINSGLTFKYHEKKARIFFLICYRDWDIFVAIPMSRSIKV